MNNNYNNSSYQNGYEQNNGYDNQGTQQMNYNHNSGNGGYIQSPYYSQQPKKRGGLIVGIIAAAGVALGVGGLVFMLGSNPKVQIARAINKTFETPYIIESIMKSGLDIDNGCSAEMDLVNSKENTKLKVGLDTDKNDNINMQVAYEGEEIGNLYGGVSLIDYEIACKLNMLDTDMQFKLDLAEQSDTVDKLLELTGINTAKLKESIDKLRKTDGNSKKEVKETSEEIVKALEEYVENLDFEKGNKEKVEINNEAVECKTFNALLNKAETEELLDLIYENIKTVGTDKDINKSLEALKDSIFKNGDAYLCIGIYKGALAKISLKTGSLEDYIEKTAEFNGGDFRAQNMTLKSNGETIIKINGTYDNNTEEYSMIIFGEEETNLGYKYNKSTGDTVLIAGDDSISAKLETGNGIKYTMESDGVSISISVKPFKDNVEAVEVSDEYSINNMTEEELYDKIVLISDGVIGDLTNTSEFEIEEPEIEIEEPEIEIEEPEATDSLLDADGKITVHIDGLPITLGVTKYEDLKNKGWTFDKSLYEMEDGGYTLSPRQYTYCVVDLTNDAYYNEDEWDQAKITVGLCNPTSSDIDLYDAYIWAIETDSRTGFELLDKYPITELSNGVSTDTEYDEALKLMGNPTYIYESDNGYDSIDYEIDDITITLEVYKDGGVSNIYVSDNYWK